MPGCAPDTPVPLRLMMSGLDGALLVIERVVVLSPVAVGLNVTPIVQVPPGATFGVGTQVEVFLLQTVVSPKPLAVTTSVAMPTFVMVSVCVLGDPIVTFPNAIGFGLSLVTGLAGAEVVPPPNVNALSGCG